MVLLPTCAISVNRLGLGGVNNGLGPLKGYGLVVVDFDEGVDCIAELPRRREAGFRLPTGRAAGQFSAGQSV